MPATRCPSSVNIFAPARLHFGFMDLSNGTQRRFGSIGMTLAAPRLHLQAKRARELQISGDGREKVQAVAETLLSSVAVDNAAAAIHVEQAIPAHQGLGSGTQIALAVGHAIAALYGAGWSSTEIAYLTGRGKRSGIGVGAFDGGGFLVDGGKMDDKSIPPITARLPIPDEWRVVLIGEADESKGLHGRREQEAFNCLPSFSDKCAGHLSRLVTMAILPALADDDFSAFAEAISLFQNRIGDYFSEVQAGRYAAPHIGEVLEYLHMQGHQGIGQSSWGPTGFAFAPNQQAAEALMAQIQVAFSSTFAVTLSITRADNIGAVINHSYSLND